MPIRTTLISNDDLWAAYMWVTHYQQTVFERTFGKPLLWLSRFGMLVMGSVFLSLTFQHGYSPWLLFWLILGLYGGVFVIGWLPDHLQARAIQCEVTRRFGPVHEEMDIFEARQLLSQEGGPDCVVLLRGVGLPHGDWVWVRVKLWKMSLEAHVDAKIRPMSDSLVRFPELVWKERVGPACVSDLTESLRRVEESGLSTLPSNVRDGFPVTVYILHRDRDGVLRGWCNLCDSNHKSTPVWSLAQRVLAAYHEHTRRRCVVRCEVNRLNQTEARDVQVRLADHLASRINKAGRRR